MENINKWRNFGDLDEVLKKELSSLTEEELKEAFYTNLSFGTGGMRGIIGVGTNRINIYTLRKANYGFAKFLLKKHSQPKVVIAYDSRFMSLEFAKESARTLASLGIKTYLFNKITPTPVLSFAVRELKAQGGIVITASHNPPQYNGYKIYDEDGCQFVPDLVEEVIKEINEAPDYFDIEVQDFDLLCSQGLVLEVSNEIDDRYLEEVKKLSLHPQLDRQNFSLVFTPLHGSAAYLGERLLQEAGYKYHLVSEQTLPDSSFPTVKLPNPEDPEAFNLAIKLAHEKNADICLATDPDADRMGIAVLDKGKYHLLNGNQIGAILLHYLTNYKEIKNGIVLTTIVSSDLGRKIAQKRSLEVKLTLTGFKFIGEQIKLLEGRKKFFFGYEESFGFLIGDFVRDKDSLQAMLLCSEVANFYKLKGKTLIDVLEDIYQEFGYHHEGFLNFNLEGKLGSEKIERIMNEFRNSEIKQINSFLVVNKEDYLLGTNTKGKLALPRANVLKYYLDDGSWFVLRPSGTEPKLKVYVATVANNKNESMQKINDIKNILQEMIQKVG